MKLDRSLIAGLDRRPRQRVLFTSVVKLCADLGARVVAEGIETIDEFKAARDCGAQYGQGYLLARPGISAAGGRVSQRLARFRALADCARRGAARGRRPVVAAPRFQSSTVSAQRS